MNILELTKNNGEKYLINLNNILSISKNGTGCILQPYHPEWQSYMCKESYETVLKMIRYNKEVVSNKQIE